MNKTYIAGLVAMTVICGLNASDITKMRDDGSWRLPEKYLRDNGFRGEVVLNGYWLKRPAGDAAAKWRKSVVPDSSKSKELYDFYREVVLPPAWHNRIIALEVDPVAGAVAVNGTVIGKPEGKRFYEYTVPANLLKDGRLRVTVTATRIVGDVYLRSYPNGPYRITGSYMRTSFRQKQLQLNLAGSGKANSEVRLVARVADNGKLVPVVKEFTGQTKCGRSEWSVELVEPWKNPKLWSEENPNLYYYDVSLKVDGKIVDQLLSRRFGFREVWIEDGSFVLNGKRTFVRDDVWEGAVDSGNSNYESAVAAMKNIKQWGLNGGMRINSETAIKAADETGILLRPSCGSFVKINIWDTKSGLTPMNGDEDKSDIIRLVKRYREHPSIICWSSTTAYALASMHPQYAGQYFNSWDFFPLNRCKAPARQAQYIFKDLVNMMKEIDPEREVAAPNGPFSRVETATRYLCDNLDLQEREDFFNYWYRSGPDRKVIWCSEYSVPFASHHYIRYIDHIMPQSGYYPALYAENGARLFGDNAYLSLRDSDYPQWVRKKFYNHMTSPLPQQMNALNIRNLLRAWRTCGINSSGHHILREYCYGEHRGKEKSSERFGFDSADPRRPGFNKPGRGNYFPMEKYDGVTLASEAYKKVNSPLMVYIGGADGNFTSKDHLYYAGAEVRKNLIVINDRDEAAGITANWKLVNSEGETVLNGSVTDRVGPGTRDLKKFIISFSAPDVTKRTDYTLQVECKSNLEGSLADAFKITVFPKHDRQELTYKGSIWLVNISDDVTHESPHFFINRDNAAFLEKAGIKVKLIKGMKYFDWNGYSPNAAWEMYKSRKDITSGTPKPGDILIIPRFTLQSGKDSRQRAIRVLQEMKLDSLIDQGLKVVIFEQAMDNVMGLETEDVRPRRAFIAAAGHPVFKGLTDSDLSYWTGSSTLEPGISAYTPDLNRFPERLWHTSNTNAVASRTYIRPQVGASRALAVSGFDLQESPLLEVCKGKGRIIFCSFDVTGRYGIDPAATRLVDNIFQYVTKVGTPDPAKNQIIRLKPGSPDVVFEKNVIRAARPSGEAGWGITRGELYFRENIWGAGKSYVDGKKTFSRPRTLPDGELPVFTGGGDSTHDGIKLPEVIRFNKGKGTFEMTIGPDSFQTGWNKRKMLWLRTALIVNQGGSLPVGPALSLQGNKLELYPVEWNSDFVHPYTANVW